MLTSGDIGWAIYLENVTECVVTGNYMANAFTGGIKGRGCDKSVFIGNSFPEGQVLYLESGDPDPTNTVVIGNIGKKVGSVRGIDVGSASFWTANIFLGNHVISGAGISGTGAPSGITPDYVGQDYQYTGSNPPQYWHKAHGVSSGNWKELG